MAKVVKFFSSYNEPETKGVPTGDGFENDYEEKIVDGQKILIKKKERRNLQAEIDACKDSCDIAKIIEKYVVSGDDSLIDKKATFFGDFTSAPKSLIEAQNQMFDAQRSFDSLSPEIKGLYHNNVFEFINDPDAMDKIQQIYEKRHGYVRSDMPDVSTPIEKVESSVKSEVKSNE